MRDVGTIVRGIRTPIIKEGDDLATIVCDSVIKASKSEYFDFEDKDIIAITEAVVGISEGNFATLDQIAKDIRNKMNSDHIGIVFPILSRNRFAVLLSAMARATKKITLLSLPFAITGILYTIYYSIDVIMLTSLVGDYATGIYNATYKLISVLNLFYSVYMNFT